MKRLTVPTPRAERFLLLSIVRRRPEFEVLTVDGEQENAIRSRLRAGMDLADEIRLQKARGRR